MCGWDGWDGVYMCVSGMGQDGVYMCVGGMGWGGVYMCMGGMGWGAVYMCGGQRLILLSSVSLHLVLREGLPPNMVLMDYDSLTSQQLLRICLSLIVCLFVLYGC